MSTTFEPMSENTKVETAKALLSVKSLTSPEKYEKIRGILVESMHTGAIEKSIIGLSKEDEFALMCKLIGTATQLVHLEQRPTIKGDFQVPDFLACFKPGYLAGGKTSSDHNGFRCLVEVKSTQDTEYSISGGRLRKLRAFANQFGFPLVFAVRFLRVEEHAFWMITEDDTSRTKLTISYNDLVSGLRKVLWDDFMYMVNPWIHFQILYDSSIPDNSETLRHTEYGQQTEFQIVSRENSSANGNVTPGNIHRVTGVDAMSLAAFFECFQPEVVDVKKHGTITYEVWQVKKPCSVTDLVYIFNRLPRDEKGRALLDPSRVLAGTDNESGLITRSGVDNIARGMWGSVLSSFSFGCPEDHLQQWIRTGGKV